jgi:hypothetical protein
MAGVAMNFGGAHLAGGHAVFGGQLAPICNYTSPLARKFVYKESSDVVYPLRRYVFRLKIKTNAEIRINEVVKGYMQSKLEGKYGINAMTLTNNVDYDHLGSIIPKDEYEVKKFTAYMTSKKNSKDYAKHLNEVWCRILFIAEANNLAGRIENTTHQYAKPATDEEFMAWFWYLSLTATVVAFVWTAAYWWYKYGQQPQYVELK